MPKTTTQLTVQERQAKLEELAAIDIAILAKTTVKELRVLAQGLLTGIHSLNKTELILKIQDLTQETRDRLAEERRIELARKEAEALASLAKTKEPEAVALREAHKATYKPEPISDRVEWTFEKLLAIAKRTQGTDTKMLEVGSLAASYINALEQRHTPSTIKSMLTDVRKALRAALEAHQGTLYYNDLEYIVERYLDALGIHFAPMMQALRTKNIVDVAAASNARIAIDGDTLVAKATDILKKISEGWQVDPINTALALATVTGRRLSEIFGNTTKMEPVSIDTVSFTGQLKARHDVLIKDTAFEIPVLADSRLVAIALGHLKSSGATMDDPENIKNKYGKPVSRAIKKYGWNSVYAGLTFKDLRAIYAVMCLGRKPEEVTPNAYLGRILGHSPDDVSTANAYQKFVPTGK